MPQARELTAAGAISDGRRFVALGIVALSSTVLDYVSSVSLQVLASRGVAFAQRLVLPLSCVNVACEAVLLIITLLFASWAKTDLAGKQLALLAFSFVSTAAVMALHMAVMIRRLLRRSAGGSDAHTDDAAMPAHASSLESAVLRGGTLSLLDPGVLPA